MNLIHLSSTIIDLFKERSEILYIILYIAVVLASLIVGYFMFNGYILRGDINNKKRLLKDSIADNERVRFTSVSLALVACILLCLTGALLLINPNEFGEWGFRIIFTSVSLLAVTLMLSFRCSLRNRNSKSEGKNSNKKFSNSIKREVAGTNFMFLLCLLLGVMTLIVSSMIFVSVSALIIVLYFSYYITRNKRYLPLLSKELNNEDNAYLKVYYDAFIRNLVLLNTIVVFTLSIADSINK